MERLSQDCSYLYGLEELIEIGEVTVGSFSLLFLYFLSSPGWGGDYEYILYFKEDWKDNSIKCAQFARVL